MPFSKNLENLTAPFKRIKNRSLVLALGFLILTFCLLLFLVLSDVSRLISGKDFFYVIQSHPKQTLIEDENYFYANKGLYKTNKEAFLRAYKIPENMPIEKRENLSKVSKIFLALLFFISSMLFGIFWRLPKRLDTKMSLESATKNELENAFQRYDALGVRFEDIAGVDEVKEELLEVIDYLKNPKKYQDLGIFLPKGVLLIGPPGVGKTMIAKALASEARVPFFYESGSAFSQIYVGAGAKKVHELFMHAKRHAPSIIFIDEIDALGKARGGHRSDEREATLNQLLTEMDGFLQNDEVVVIGATNQMEVMDEALLRSKRFDRRIFISLPDLLERQSILEKLLENKKHALNYLKIAKICVGFSGATLATLINESALNALKHQREEIIESDILEVKDKIAYGKKKPQTLDENQKELVALYQSAKALSAYWLEIEFDKAPLLGEFIAFNENKIHSESEIKNYIKVYLSGTIVLELLYKERYSLSKQDLQKAKFLNEFMASELLLAPTKESLSVLYEEQLEFLKPQIAACKRLSTLLLEQEYLEHANFYDLLNG
ncbi:ATP-dependent metallopeptidase FtsH/Yme1/Tma family protein [Helicobacter pylori]|uniref:AAA family ATPase n=1 Tax=Helicobacter pylori TaxID=210 RepID=UPI000C311248|nr:ATP-dependent metallopeptidase FtsH/Yme1/Tma family protein [Helicobacter pylori]WRE53353.1 ATP-dependent metallopeptidase FtsH/Yme1/Tma family protein [Helicobacter pylori]